MLSVFSFRGQARRSEWWLVNILSSIVAQAAAVLGTIAFVSHEEWHFRTLGIAAFLVVLLAIEVDLATTVRRLRDRGRSPWWLLAFLIPYLGWIYLVIECGFLPGRDRPGCRKLVRTIVTEPGP